MKKIVVPLLICLLMFASKALAQGGSIKTNTATDQSQALTYAPVDNSRTDIASFPVVPNAGFPDANGYHFPGKDDPGNAMEAKELTHFKRSYTVEELRAIVTGKNFYVVPEIFKKLPATNKVAVYVEEFLPLGKYEKLANLTVTGKGSNETTHSAGAMGSLWGATCGANVVLIYRNGYNRYFNSKTFAGSSSALGAAIDGAKNFAGGLAALFGYTSLESEHKGRPFVNVLILRWEPLDKTPLEVTPSKTEAINSLCQMLREKDPMFNASYYGCQEEN